MDAITKTVQSTHPPALKPHLPLLIQCMLEGLSNLEDIRLNYVEQHAERLGLDQEKLESARVNAARSSPMVSNNSSFVYVIHCHSMCTDSRTSAHMQGDTLDVCTRYNDAASLEAIVPVLIVNIKRGVGLNTKVCPLQLLFSTFTPSAFQILNPKPISNSHSYHW